MKSKYYIIVDKDNRPMSFDSDDRRMEDRQLCYCYNSFPVKIVTSKQAQKQIEITIKNRIAWGCYNPEIDIYQLMPVKMK
jgi:hypothetical protein